jgi:hypothetical protein
MNQIAAGASPDTIVLAGQPMPRAAAWAAVARSARWFWWVAGLSFVNSVASAMHAKFAMVLGLGVTRLIDEVFLAVAAGPATTLLHFGLVLVPIAAFFFLGRSSAKGSTGAWITGMVLYLCDGLVYLLAQDWLAVIFHAFVLFMLFTGFNVMRAVRRAEADAASAPAQSASVDPALPEAT